VKVTIVHVPDCPNLGVLRRRLALVLIGREDVAVFSHVVDTAERAEQWAMAGSPTVLIDGRDPFAEPGQAASLSCRLYRDEAGGPACAPSLAQLRDALNGPMDAAAGAGRGW
jgi:hypothetical protein